MREKTSNGKYWTIYFYKKNLNQIHNICSFLRYICFFKTENKNKKWKVWKTIIYHEWETERNNGKELLKLEKKKLLFRFRGRANG